MTPTELQEERRRLGLTQAQLAGRLGVNQTTVSRWETGACRLPAMVELALDRIPTPPESPESP